MSDIYTKTIDLGDGREIVLETGRLARQADGSVLLRMGRTMLLATVVSAKEAREDVDFMPLSVDYKEKFASLGRIPGGFMKREARPSDYEVLIARLVDRVLRPLFPEDYHADTFVNINLISADKDTMPDALAGLAASAALAVSDVPIQEVISEVRVGRMNGEFIINPSFSQVEECDIDIIVGATKENIMMVEGEMKEVSEKEMLEAIKFAHEAIKQQCIVQEEMMKELGIVKRQYEGDVEDEALKEKVWEETYDKVYEVARQAMPDKHKRSEAFDKIRDKFLEQYDEEARAEVEKLVKRYFHDVHKEAVRRLILDEGIRLDGRQLDEIRPITCEADFLPAAHGSALFTRGETQSLTTVTLGTKLDEKIIDEVLVQGTEKFVLHYNFPPFSTGDARPNRGVSRREIGHGNLAHRALKNMLPPEEEIPYAIRVVSDILESNGSSSMATVCAGTMALMDAGIQIKRPVSGIAMGLIKDKDSDKYAVLSDILGDEDHLGDMDFKVAGTTEGITATQMDIKVDGLSYDILEKALEQAKAGRMHILGIMKEAIAEPRPDLKPHAPRIVQMTIPKEMIGPLIGPGGKIVQEIQRETNTTIVIEEISEVGVVDIYGENKEAIDAAVERVNEIVALPEVGKTYKGVVKTIVPFGAFVEIMPGKEGLLHISEVEWRRLENLDGILKEGDEIEVKLIGQDEKNGKMKLSRKVLLPKPEGYKEPPSRGGGHRDHHRPHRPHHSGQGRKNN
jgi:polyribonucleotide nucleotidyltransferase